jgi:predicted small lipoprotein YifL
MKKLLALLLALTLCVSLCACGQKESASAAGGGAIAKPDAAAATEAPEKAVAAAETAPAPAEAPAAEPAVTIEVRDYCDIAGTYLEAGGYCSRFSFCLPEVSGPDTDYLRALNAAVEAIYADYVQESLDALNDEVSLPHYCVCYQYTVTGGVNSLLISCDTDWGEDYYWCFNFDDAGNKVENADVLAAAGMTEGEFVSAVRDFYTDWTDLSAYFEDDSWKEYQEQTLAADNCNADLPMVLLPDDTLCFIGTIYTPAGAGVYDYALEFVDSREIAVADIGTPLLSRLSGSYLVDAKSAGLEDDDTAYLLDFVTVGDTLTVEVTGFGAEGGSVMFYYAADIYPADPADLLRADVDSVPVRVLSYCPDVFTGTYYGEPGYYTMTVGRDYVSFTNYEGGAPLLGGSEGFTAYRAYRDDLGVADPVPDTNYEMFDFDAIRDSGLSGVWAGNYIDTDYNTHSLTLELTSWGQMKLRDCVDGEIPRVMLGSYYLNAFDGDYPAGTVVFDLVRCGGYKMPCMGCCDMFLDDGVLLIDEEIEGWYGTLTAVDYENYYSGLVRVPSVRFITEPRVLSLAENETASLDLDFDGTAEELSYSFTRDKNSGDTITDLTVSVDGFEYSFDDLWFYDAEVYLVQPGCSGQAFFYVDAATDNDGHYTLIVGVSADAIWPAGDYYGGFAETPTDPEALTLCSRVHLLSTVNVERYYRVGVNGLPEATEPFFYAQRSPELTSKRDLDVWVSTTDTAELVDTTTLPAGTKVTLLCTDGKGFWDLELENGDCRRVWVSKGDDGQTIDGVNIEDCFDGIIFGG